jgi:hypothetical protein
VAEPKWHGLGFKTPKRMGKDPDEAQKDFRKMINYSAGKYIDKPKKKGIIEI